MGLISDRPSRSGIMTSTGLNTSLSAVCCTRTPELEWCASRLNVTSASCSVANSAQGFAEANSSHCWAGSPLFGSDWGFGSVALRRVTVEVEQAVCLGTGSNRDKISEEAQKLQLACCFAVVSLTHAPTSSLMRVLSRATCTRRLLQPSYTHNFLRKTTYCMQLSCVV